MKTRAILLVPVVAAVLACDATHDLVTTPEPIPEGAMAYAGFDENGAKVVEGWVKLEFAPAPAGGAPPVNVTGTWSLHPVGSAGEIGPQVGQGTLEGLLQDSQLGVNLTPSLIDDNVFAGGTFEVLAGPIDGTRWTGTWSWITLAGVRRSGTFTAAN